MGGLHIPVFLRQLSQNSLRIKGEEAGTLEPTDNGFLIVDVVQKLLQETREISVVKRGVVLVVPVEI
jgi:hypothetical protein